LGLYLSCIVEIAQMPPKNYGFLDRLFESKRSKRRHLCVGSA